MAINPGTETACFLLEGSRYKSIARYRVRVGPSVHEYIDSYRQVTCLLWSDSEKAAADNGDRPGYINGEFFFDVLEGKPL